jgi:hypothetical protein
MEPTWEWEILNSMYNALIQSDLLLVNNKKI